MMLLAAERMGGGDAIVEGEHVKLMIIPKA